MHTKEEKLKAFGDFLDVLDTLREKCPWDRKQTNESLRPNTVEEVYEDVRTRIETFGPGGGYVICDSNSVPGWCSPRNVMAMSEAVEKYRYIYG